jgi:hypothetical protein
MPTTNNRRLNSSDFRAKSQRDRPITATLMPDANNGRLKYSDLTNARLAYQAAANFHIFTGQHLSRTPSRVPTVGIAFVEGEIS